MAQRPKRKPDLNKTKHAQRSKPTQPESAALKPMSDTSGAHGQDVKPPKPGAVARDSGLRARPLVEATYGLTEAGIIQSAGESSLLQDRIIRHLQNYHPIRRTTAQIACELGVAEQIIVSVMGNFSRTTEATRPPAGSDAVVHKRPSDLEYRSDASLTCAVSAATTSEAKAAVALRAFRLTSDGCAAAKKGQFGGMSPDEILVVGVLLAPLAQPCSRRLDRCQLASESGLSCERVDMAIETLTPSGWIE
jgi:hypothetical protein